MEMIFVESRFKGKLSEEFVKRIYNEIKSMEMKIVINDSKTGKSFNKTLENDKADQLFEVPDTSKEERTEMVVVRSFDINRPSLFAFALSSLSSVKRIPFLYKKIKTEIIKD